MLIIYIVNTPQHQGCARGLKCSRPRRDRGIRVWRNVYSCGSCV